MSQEVFKFRRGTIQTINMVTKRLETWYIFKFTSPASFKGAYGAVNGAWKWPTRSERDDALRITKKHCN